MSLIALKFRLPHESEAGGEGGQRGSARAGCSRDYRGKSCVHAVSLQHHRASVAKTRSSARRSGSAAQADGSTVRP